MGMLAGGFFSQAGEQPNVTVSGESLADVKPSVGGTARCGVRVNSDGTIDKREGAAYTQIDASTDWIIPNGDADSTFEAKIEENSCTSCTGVSFFNPGGSGKGLSTWFTLGSNREWYVEKSSLGVATWNISLHVRKGSSGPALDIGTYTMALGWTS